MRAAIVLCLVSIAVGAEYPALYYPVAVPGVLIEVVTPSGALYGKSYVNGEVELVRIDDPFAPGSVLDLSEPRAANPGLVDPFVLGSDGESVWGGLMPSNGGQGSSAYPVTRTLWKIGPDGVAHSVVIPVPTVPGEYIPELLTHASGPYLLGWTDVPQEYGSGRVWYRVDASNLTPVVEELVLPTTIWNYSLYNSTASNFMLGAGGHVARLYDKPAPGGGLTSPNYVKRIAYSAPGEPFTLLDFLPADRSFYPQIIWPDGEISALEGGPYQTGFYSVPPNIPGEKPIWRYLSWTPPDETPTVLSETTELRVIPRHASASGVVLAYGREVKGTSLTLYSDPAEQRIVPIAPWPAGAPSVGTAGMSDQFLIAGGITRLISPFSAPEWDSVAFVPVRSSDCSRADVTTTAAAPGSLAFYSPDGVLDGEDLSVGVERWLAGSLMADLNTTHANPGDADFGEPDGRIDGADLACFVEQWVTGCQ